MDKKEKKKSLWVKVICGKKKEKYEKDKNRIPPAAQCSRQEDKHSEVG